MVNDIFQGYEIKEMDGELVVILDLNTAKEEIAAEFGYASMPSSQNLQQTAETYIRKIFPKLKIARIHIMADSLLITSFPLQNATHRNKKNLK
jgi:hypothetical protein